MFIFTSLRPMQTFPRSGQQSLYGCSLKTWLINLYFQLCEQEKMSSIKLEKENLSKFNLLVFPSQAEDIQKEVILKVFTLFRSRYFNSQMCFRK